MTTAQLDKLTESLPERDRDEVRERAAIMEEANHWTTEEANRRAWAGYLEHEPKELL